MTTIEKKAKEFVDAPCGWLCANCASDKMSCRFYNDKESFKAGAEWMREELTRWNDPKESRPENGQRILVKYKKADNSIKIGIATFHRSFNIGCGAFVMERSRPRYIIGWREIHEG